MPFRNLPIENAELLSSLVEIHPQHVSSMGLTKDAGFDMTLLAFADGESVSEEEYFGDTLYYLVEGNAVIVFADKRVPVQTGEVLMVPAHVSHAIEGLEDCAFKVLQINL